MCETKKCFACKKELPLTYFAVDRRKYQLKSDKGTCKVCFDCEEERALKTLSLIRFNFQKNEFEIITFETKEDVYNYFTHKIETR